MKKYLFHASISKVILALGLGIIGLGCGAPEMVNTNTNRPAGNVAVNSPSNINSAPAVVESEALTPVTLPVLDAMLSDEAFVTEAKSTLQVTDDELQKLKDVSRNAIAELNEDETGDDTRSTRAANSDAKTKSQGVLGQDRGARFMALAQKRWNVQDEGSVAAAAPGSIPTDTRIVVNAPAYRMDIFKEGKLHKTYKIGIGYPEFPLPVGTRKASNIIFNPTWTPPDEPWVKGKIQAGKMVAAGSPDNPLGPIKIPIGLPSLIHGGKSPARLGTFASHGCVGLTSPQVQDFAMELAALSGGNLTLADIKAYEKTKTETKDVKLEKAVPVELRYETITVEDGKLKLYRDVYERGTNTEANLRRVLDAFGVSFDSLKESDRVKILAGLKQMAVDAGGNPVTADNSMATNSNSASNSANQATGNKNKNANASDGRVTRNIKGKKEVVFELAELKGKGYPAPVGMKM